MILLNRLKYGLFLVFNKMIILLFVVSSFAIADNQVKILMLGDSLTQGYGLEEKSGLVPVLQRWLSSNETEVFLINGGVSILYSTRRFISVYFLNFARAYS